jgi:4'-phosphopantetheinyl transferase
LRFHYNAQGKPTVAHPTASTSFSFNLSHSGEVALCAIAGFETVGVDVEAVRESRELVGIARRFFSVAEQEALLALPPEQQCAAFYQCWSSKEALLKAWGTGLATPLDRFDVSVAPGETSVLSIALPEWSGTPWCLYPVVVPEGFAATLALPAPATRLQRFEWPPGAPALSSGMGAPPQTR